VAERPQCWAFHTDGTRCQHKAGHGSVHRYTVEWDDQVVWVPAIKPAEPVISITDADLEALSSEQVTPAGQCVVCHHLRGAHDDDGCQASAACECLTFVG